MSKKKSIKSLFFPKFDVSALDTDYVKDNNYSIEKEYDFANFRFIYGPFLSEFYKNHQHYIDKLKEYENSPLYRVKHNYNKGRYGEYEHIIKENSKNVNFLIKKGNKETKVRSKRFNNNLIKYLDTVSRLQFYNRVLKKYKSDRDQGKSDFLMFEMGEEFSSAEEFKNIKLLISNTREYLNQLKKDTSKIKDANAWADFLNKTLDVEHKTIEYGINLVYLKDLPEFNKDELKTIYNHRKNLNKDLNKNTERTL
ncbi:MAG: hypothetical protein ACOCP4_03645 [Candidatus Woesearchaeota archaeon]